MYNAYYYGGIVYKVDLKDNELATSLYEEFLQKVSDSPYHLPVYYQQFIMYSDLNKPDKSKYYKELLLSKYPESPYAKLVQDKNYYKILLDREKEKDNLYETTYQLFKEGQSERVIALADSAIAKYSKDPILPKFELLKLEAMGKTIDPMAFRNALNDFIAKYPKDPVSSQAKLIAFWTFTNLKLKWKKKKGLPKKFSIHKTLLLSIAW